MVTKRTEPAVNTVGASQPQLPYPTSPIGPAHASASEASVYPPDERNSMVDPTSMGEAHNKRRDSDVSSHGTWDDSDDEEDEKPVEVPQPLRITPSKQNLGEQSKRDEIPAILKPGPSQLSVSGVPDTMDHYAKQALANPWADDSVRLTPQSTGRSNNPYLQPQFTGNRQAQPETPSWTDQTSGISRPPIPNALLPPTAPQPPPQVPQTVQQPPINSIPQAPPPPPQAVPPPPPVQPVELPTTSTPTHELSRLSLGATTAPAAGVSGIARKPLSPAHARPPSALPPVTDTTAASPWQPGVAPTAQQKWGADDELYAPPSGPPSGPNLVDIDVPPPQPPRTQPPSISTTQANASQTTGRLPDTPRTIERRQRSEHYQIKHVNWQDSSTGSSSMRRSPILTQNANGPCPLLALVNALVLTTPANANTALIETLSTREQISLGLLLDAVFDELMSGRRGDSATSLPDVSELYAFLLALHTGMNVNPRFVSNGSVAPGFEQTREMKFYSTFSIPLIHGWLPPRGGPAYEAFDRRAQSFEDAQNIQFAESELEEKLRAQGLTNEEQQILQDIQTIKHFLITWPTQLTDHGLEVISATLKPGHFAILFRNDHFSTIYKEPTHGALMTLVTDSGYSSHDEIVWESLVDVNGATSELFSGDFRTVSHNSDVRLNQGNSAGGDDGWETVPSRNRQSREEVPPPLPGPRPTVAPAAATATSTEQEDHDFALALQLQEEEDARQRDEQRRRQEQQQLSEQFISGQNEGRPPAIPPRRGGSRQSTSIRPPVNRPADALDGPDAPPTYEQSASDRPYRENGGQSTTLDTYDALRRQEQSAYAAQSANASSVNVTHGRRQSHSNRLGRRTSQSGAMPGALDNAGGRRPGQAATAQDAEERCAVM